MEEARPLVVSNRIYFFDVIRVFAMVMIIVFHFNAFCIDFQVNMSPILFVGCANGTMGTIGVSLFFVLSGASLMYAYRGKLEPRHYYVRRFLAVYPLYWITYAAFFTHFYIIHRMDRKYPASRLLLSFLGMDGYLYYKIPCYYLVGEWFVGCIILIYLLFPVLRKCVREWPVRTAAVTLAVYPFFLYFYPFEMERDHFFLTRIPEVMAGMYLVLWMDKRGDWRVPAKVGVPAVAVFLLTMFIEIPFLSNCVIWLIGVSGFLGLAWLANFVEWRPLLAPMQYLAAASFAIFLVHHVLVGGYIGPLQGLTVGAWTLRLVFVRYFIRTCIVGYVFYKLSQVLSGTLKVFMKHVCNSPGI